MDKRNLVISNPNLGKYQLHEELGHGGYGTVHRAYDTVLEVERAVKVLKPELAADKDFIERFKREAKLAAQLDHPRIVPAYDLEEDQGYYFLAMKYMPGKSLKDILAQKGNLSFDRALEITHQVAEALDYLHDQNFVHRDVKPGNILFDKDGNAYISDLGFAKALLGTTGTSQTTTGAMIGTPSYMAPELWREKGVSSATDVYSLGCVFYEMITGKVLFEGETSASIMAKHVMDGPKFGSQWSPDVPAGVKRVLRKALAKITSKRYEKPSKFYQALKALMHKENGRNIPIWVWIIGGALSLLSLVLGMRLAEQAQQTLTSSEYKAVIGQVTEPENLIVTGTPMPTSAVTVTFIPIASNTPERTNTLLTTLTNTQTITPSPINSLTLPTSLTIIPAEQPVDIGCNGIELSGDWEGQLTSGTKVYKVSMFIDQTGCSVSGTYNEYRDTEVDSKIFKDEGIEDNWIRITEYDYLQIINDHLLASYNERVYGDPRIILNKKGISETPTLTVPLSSTRIPIAYVLNNNTAMRESPYISRTLEYLSSGDEVEVFGILEDASWIFIASASDIQGWTQTENVDFAGRLNSIPVVSKPPTPTPSNYHTITISISRLESLEIYFRNVYDGSHDSCRLVDEPVSGRQCSVTLPAGEIYYSYEVKGGIAWRYGSGHGFLNSDFFWLISTKEDISSFP